MKCFSKRSYTTPPRLARETGYSVNTILTFIRSGELKAHDGSMPGAGRPSWRIHQDDWLAFVERRSNQQKKPARPRRNQKKTVRQFV